MGVVAGGGLFDEVQNMSSLRQIELCAGVLNEYGNNTSIVAKQCTVGQHEDINQK